MVVTKAASQADVGGPARGARACPACGGADTGPAFTKDGYGFARCAACAFSFIDPPLDQAALTPIYASKAAPDEGLRYPFNKPAHRRRRALVRAFRLRRHFRGRAAIDFGCGGGFMVEAMRRLGAASAAGYDPDEGAIAFARQRHGANTFYSEPMEAFLARGLTFDFGHSSQVIEHVGDPAAFVDAWAQVLAPGGVFYLKTPDRAHWRTGEHPEDWPGPPSYVQYFSREAITRLLGRHGFAIRKVRFALKPTVELIAVRR